MDFGYLPHHRRTITQPSFFPPPKKQQSPVFVCLSSPLLLSFSTEPVTHSLAFSSIHLSSGSYDLPIHTPSTHPPPLYLSTPPRILLFSYASSILTDHLLTSFSYTRTNVCVRAHIPIPQKMCVHSHAVCGCVCVCVCVCMCMCMYVCALTYRVCACVCVCALTYRPPSHPVIQKQGVMGS